MDSNLIVWSKAWVKHNMINNSIIKDAEEHCYLDAFIPYFYINLVKRYCYGEIQKHPQAPHICSHLCFRKLKDMSFRAHPSNENLVISSSRLRCLERRLWYRNVLYPPWTAQLSYTKRKADSFKNWAWSLFWRKIIAWTHKEVISYSGWNFLQYACLDQNRLLADFIEVPNCRSPHATIM